MARPKVRGISTKTWRSLDLASKAAIYAGDMASARAEALAADPDIGRAKAHDMRSQLLDWAHADFIEGAERETDLLNTITVQKKTIARLKELLAQRGVRLPSSEGD